MHTRSFTTIRQGLRGLGLLAVLGLCIGAAPALAQDVARLVVVIGTVEIGTGEPPVWRAAQTGDELRAGDSLRTGSDGRVELQLPTGRARVYEDSLLRLPSDWAAGLDESVELDRGSSLFDVLRQGRTFEVRTPEAIAMVKGTQFSVSVDAAGAAVEVFRGLVGVRSPSGKLLHEVLVRPGATAVGGRDVPFTLRFVESHDSWGAWSKGGERPPVPAALIDRAIEGASLRGVRVAVQAAVEHRLPDIAPAGAFERTRLARARIKQRKAGKSGEKPSARARLPRAPKSKSGSHRRLRGSRSGHGNKALGITTASAPEFAGAVQESFLEQALDPTGGLAIQFVTSGGPNYFQITGGGGINVQLDETQLFTIKSGDPTPLGPALLGLLTTRGVNEQLLACSLLLAF